MTIEKGNKSFLSYLFLFSLIGSAISYTLQKYFIHREPFFPLLANFLLLFTGYLYIVWQGPKILSIKNLIILAMILRVLFLGHIPSLSEDFFRFLWDGNLFVNGINPYLSVPADAARAPEITSIPLFKSLFDGMTTLSRGNYTCYPALNQFLFSFAAWVFPHSLTGQVLVLRLIIILSELGTLIFMKKILEKTGKNAFNLLWYAFNPLVIIELTGNLHFEAVMIFFLATGLYYLIQQRFVLSALALAFAVSIKLLPLVFLPALVKKMRFVKGMLYSALVLIINIVLFLPYLGHGLLHNLWDSLDLYFQTFEFNASIYYVAREIGYLVKGYNLIALIGPLLAGVSFMSILLVSFFRKTSDMKDLISSCLFVLSIYFLFTTTVHPWYITTLVFLSVFTRYKYAVIWSLTIILSYHAYSASGNQELLWLLALEYLLVIAFFVLELLPFTNKMFKWSFEIHTAKD